ncbi:MAG: nicotinate (nicotinamide) nucleotide adenylyltransferase [Gemmatimonadaceae bacterium]|nr:nicotinate (nicotinamide) nucleotide adenylyltransferase [Gemmatimonadaceae bacterium]MBX9855202.1 nicotinate (nicotinamide) nucleotide adenylyltransferase [Gemmatimonadaceae bacterium]
MRSPLRIGLFGGSFDPPHVGHLLMVQDVRDQLALDRLLVIPAAQQPLKGNGQTPAVHRLAMAQACFADIPDCIVDPAEIERGGLSFMVDTVADLRRRWPDADLHLLVGHDVVPTLPRWKDIDRLLTQVQLVVMDRDGAGVGDHELVHGGVQARRLAVRRVDVSSTEIRARVATGRSIRGFVTDAVATYIASTGLYRENSRASAATDS